MELDLSELKLTKKQKLEVAQAVIDKIVANAEKGKDRQGKSLPKYSKDYKDSDAFGAFGKSTKPNMTLTGDLLGQIDVIDVDGDTVLIGWADEQENLKAHGNITGQEGLWPAKRDFFGLPPKEIKEILDGYSEE